MSNYRLVMNNRLARFNEEVNDLLNRGYEFRDDRAVNIEYRGGTTQPIFSVEMIRYEDQMRTHIDLDALRGMPQTEAVEREVVEDEVMAAPEAPPIRAWTADSPDPFDDDDEFDEEVVNEHQMNRIGLHPNQMVMEDTVEEEPVRARIGDQAPNEALRQAVREVEARMAQRTETVEEDISFDIGAEGTDPA